MIWTMSTSRKTLLAATLAGVILSLPQVSIAAGQAQTPGVTPSAQATDPAESAATARLDKKQFSNVKVSVDQGTATLTGTVEFYQFKADADNRVRKTKGVTAVRNLIQVAGPDIPDPVLEDKLREKLEYDRVFYGNVFNAITVSVQNGGVTLGGHAVSYFARNSALNLVNFYPGVKNVADEIQVDPVSTFDNRIRMQTYRAIYGYPPLNRYAIDPAKPIRISVQNGHVELYGLVDRQADKDMAFMRANAVPGVFDVKNYLQVANPQASKKK
jgi:osmotically-inducible protein OsmY